jgi:malonate-semialdehyde dehydrogenase (acetylating)/methylmalonate-semialdehyde dehydrogenase
MPAPTYRRISVKELPMSITETPSTPDVPVIGHWVDGALRASGSGRTAPVYNPATGAVRAQVALADQAEIDAAIASAQAGFEVWSGFSIAKRQTVLFSFRELLNSRKGELAAIITAEHGKRVQALGGAKNHMLVLPDADLDLVADQAVNAGYGAAGERCMAISVVLAVVPVADELIAKITERIAKLTIGNGAGVDAGDGKLSEPDMGPLITDVHRDKVSGYVDIAEADGAKIVVDGRGLSVDGHEDGFFFGPTLIDGLPTSSRAYTEEIFGPVLSVVRVSTYDEGLDLINSGQFGNGTAIFTNDGGAARRFQHEVQVGMIGINVPIPVPVAYHSFGGWKQSLFGDAKAYGTHGFDFFTREKAITSRWLDPATRTDTAHGGINLGFPQNH